MTTTNYEATIRFAGKCDACVYPIVREVEGHPSDTLRANCPECGTSIVLDRLYGSWSDHNCDSRCQHALGNICVCSCGGANHQRGYIPMTFNGEVPAPLLKKYRDGVARRKAAAERRASTRAASKAEAMAAAINETLEVWADDGSPLGDAMRLDVDLAETFGLSGYGLDTVSDIRNKFHKYGSLSDGQVRFATDLVVKAVKRQERIAQREANPPTEKAPSGKATVVGVVVYVKEVEDGYSYTGIGYKCLVVATEGYKVWGTLPKGVEKGDRISLTRTFARSNKDEFFSFYKGNGKVVVLEKGVQVGEADVFATSLD